MLSYRILIRNVNKKIINPTFYKITQNQFCTSSDDENSRKTEKKITSKIEESQKSKNALQKLNVLLKQMIEEEPKKVTTSLDLAKPKPRVKNDKNESTPNESIDNQIMNAARNVAESIGGNNVKQTESELLSKLLNSTSPQKEESTTTEKSFNISEIISGMKIDRSTTTLETSRAHQVRKSLEHGERISDRYPKVRGQFDRVGKDGPKRKEFTPRIKIDLFGKQSLGIFTPEEIKKDLRRTDPVELKTWNKLQERELRLAVTHPPENYFQELILWTQQGKLWKFPIDNEQGMEEEQNVCFTEHIFLDKHLESWCPTKGPIRHFMELVCVGLSKNPYLTAQAKKDHILWYQDYFLSKKSILEEIGAMPAQDQVKQITE